MMETMPVQKQRKHKAARTVVLPPIRCSVEEQQRIRERAKNASLSVSHYVRSMAVSGRIVLHQEQKIDPAYVEQLRRIGVNLNQITKAVHEQRAVPDELYRLLERINRVMDEAAGEVVRV